MSYTPSTEPGAAARGPSLAAARRSCAFAMRRRLSTADTNKNGAATPHTHQRIRTGQNSSDAIPFATTINGSMCRSIA